MDKESETLLPTKISWPQMLLNQGVLTQQMLDHRYEGNGTEEDPYLVVWLENDPRDPMNWAFWHRILMGQVLAYATLAVAFVSSAYTGGVKEVALDFHVGVEVDTLGISLFVLGFALGPLIWAPLSEMYGRQILFVVTYAILTIFNGAAVASPNIQTLIVLRFLAGAFGSSPLTNVGGVIADIHPAKERGTVSILFALAPFLGPVIGPIVGDFMGETVGWRWILGLLAIFTGVLGIAVALAVPETYAPVLLRKRAASLSKKTGMVYKSRADVLQGRTKVSQAFKKALGRPWVLLLREPIVLLLSLFVAVVYGTLYMMFAAYPIVFNEIRGWSQGIAALPFLGVMVGMFFGAAYSLWYNRRYARKATEYPDETPPPEARLPPAIIGACAIPIGLFWFAWTNAPDQPWPSPVCAGAPFGFGMLLLFISIMNYLIDSYTIYAASVLAANALLRSLFGAVFPLFTNAMYENLGLHWASSVPAFLSLACVPFPFLFYKYGSAIRARCKYSAEADEFMKKIRAGASQRLNQPNSGGSSGTNESGEGEKASPSMKRDEHANSSNAEHNEEPAIT